MNPDHIKFNQILQKNMSTVPPAMRETVVDELIAAGVTLSETAQWKIPTDTIQDRPYCTRCGEEALFDGWGKPKWSKRCPNCGAIMTNTKEK